MFKFSRSFSLLAKLIEFLVVLGGFIRFEMELFVLLVLFVFACCSFEVELLFCKFKFDPAAAKEVFDF